jgi:hypothetical protein
VAVILDLRHAQGDGSHEDYNDRDGSGTFDILWLRVCRGQRRRRGSGWSRWWYLDWHSSPRSRARCDRAWYVQHNTRFHHRNGDRECDGRNCHSGPNARYSGAECQRPLQRCVVNDGWRRLLIPFAGEERVFHSKAERCNAARLEAGAIEELWIHDEAIRRADRVAPTSPGSPAGESGICRGLAPN